MYENENPVFDNVDAYLEERLTPPDETLELTLKRSRAVLAARETPSGEA